MPIVLLCGFLFVCLFVCFLFYFLLLVVRSYHTVCHMHNNFQDVISKCRDFWRQISHSICTSDYWSYADDWTTSATASVPAGRADYVSASEVRRKKAEQQLLKQHGGRWLIASVCILLGTFT